MEHVDPRIRQDATDMTQAVVGDAPGSLEARQRPNWREILRAVLSRLRQEHRPATRRELSRDRSRSMFALVAASVALLLIFFSVFSNPKKRVGPGETARGPNLGRKMTPGQEQQENKQVAPMLSAEVRGGDGPTNQVTPEDVGRTSHVGHEPAQPTLPAGARLDKPSPSKSGPSQDYALKNVDFSDPVVTQAATPIAGPQVSANRQPSIVFVRSTNTTPALKQQIAESEPSRIMALLPAGTRLIARLQAPVSSAVPTPVVAVVEYNYERDGEIVVPAGAKVFGRLSDVNRSGLVAIHFYRVEIPDGSSEAIDASAMDLKFGPLKGYVSGRKRGSRFLVRSLAGVGTVAAYIVGGHGTSAFDRPISENTLLRERIADNLSVAGQDELNTLSMNQNIVVTVPGNTRFYIVLDRGGSDQGQSSGLRKTNTASLSVADSHVPSLEELRELIQLRRELSQMYQQTSTSTPAGAQDVSADSQR